MNRLLPLLLAVTLFSGCGDPKEASKPNFEKAINAYFQTAPECIDVFVRDKLPVTVQVSGYSTSKVERYDRFVKVGLLKATDGEAESAGLFSKERVKTRQYELTDEGKRYYFEDASNPVLVFAVGASRGFCFGKRSVAEIKNFSEPSNLDGLTVSQVNFTYRISDVAKWSEDSDIRAAFPEMAKKLTTPAVDGKATLVKTGDGWVHESMFKR